MISLGDGFQSLFKSCRRERRINTARRVIPETPMIIPEGTAEIPAAPPQDAPSERLYSRMIHAFMWLKMRSAMSDTVKVNFQRLCQLHLEYNRAAFAVLGEIGAPAYTISKSSADAIANGKLKFKRNIAILEKILDRYGKNRPVDDHALIFHNNEWHSPFEFVAENLELIENFQKDFAKIGLEMELFPNPGTQLIKKMASIEPTDGDEKVNPEQKTIDARELRILITDYLRQYPDPEPGSSSAPPEIAPLSDDTFCKRYLPLMRSNLPAFIQLGLNNHILLSPEDELKECVLYVKKMGAFYRHSLTMSLLWTLPISGLIVSMPYLLNAFGNDVLMGMEPIIIISALSPLSTVLTTMNASMMEIHANYFQSRLTTIEWIRDLLQMAASYTGLHFQNPYIILLGQLIPNLMNGAIGSINLISLIRKIKSRAPLSSHDKQEINRVIWKQIVGTSAQAILRMLTPIVLASMSAHVAVFSYNVFYFLVFACLGLIRAVSVAYTQMRIEHGYENRGESLERHLIAAASALSFILAVIFGLTSKWVIPFINKPSIPEAIEANTFVEKWWLLGCSTLAVTGWSLVAQDKAQKYFDLRLLVSLMTVLPAAIGFFGALPFGGNAAVIGIVFGWLSVGLITIAFSHCSSYTQGEPVDRYRQRARPAINPSDSATHPLLRDHDGDRPKSSPMLPTVARRQDPDRAPGSAFSLIPRSPGSHPSTHPRVSGLTPLEI